MRTGDNFRKKKATKVNKTCAEEYLTNGLLNFYKYNAEKQRTFVPEIIYDLLVFTGTLTKLRRADRLVRANAINLKSGAWLENSFKIGQ